MKDKTSLILSGLPQVKAPTHLIVGSLDSAVIGLNQEAYEALDTVKKLIIINGANHLFEEPSTLEQVAEEASEWFLEYLK